MATPIVVEHLPRTSGKRRGVTDLMFEVASGEVFGFLGPNGAGRYSSRRTFCMKSNRMPIGSRSSATARSSRLRRLPSWRGRANGRWRSFSAEQCRSIASKLPIFSGYDVQPALAHGTVNWLGVILLTLVGPVCTAAALAIFQRRDVIA